MNQDANDFLFSEGSKAAKFENIGDSVEGTVVDFDVKQQTDLDNGTPLTWTDGSPRMQMVISLQTTDRADGDDDGIRRIFAKGGNYEVAEGTGTSMKKAIGDAVKKAGASKFETGATLKVGYSGVGKKTNRGFNAPKLYRATYTLPVKSVNADELWGE